MLRSVVGLGRLELPTSRLSSARSNQLSYKPDEASSQQPMTPLGQQALTENGRETKAAARRRLSSDDVGIARERSETSILRKEVIQPQVPLRLPCYDFGPVADPTVAGCLLAVSAPS